MREYGPGTRMVFVNDVDPIRQVVIGDESFSVVKDWNFTPYRKSPGDFTLFTVGMGAPRAKRIIVEKALMAGLLPGPPLLSHDVVVRPDVRLGRGLAIHPQSFIGSNSSVGDYVIVHKAAVACDVVIGDYATCAPHSTTGAGAKIGDGVYLGGRAAVAPGVAIAPWVRIGLNAAVREDVIVEDTAFVGNPLRKLTS